MDPPKDSSFTLPRCFTCLASRCFYVDVEPKIGGKKTKMDDENDGKPYE